MDCRKPLAVVVCLLAGVSGCVPGSWFSRSTAPPPWATVEPAVSESDKKPKPMTYVALAALQEQQASEPNVPPEQQEQLRERARRAYQRALALDPKCVAAHAALARMCDKANNPEQAVAHYAQALKLSPKDASLHHEVGMFHARHKDWEHALEHLRRAAELDPENKQIVKSYGLGLARNNRVEESLVQFRKIMPEAEARYTLARMLRHLDQVEQSKDQAQLAIRANPVFEPAHRLLAELEGRAMSPPVVPAGNSEPETGN